MRHEVYSGIVAAIRAGRLPEPFTNEDFRRACPKFGEGTYKAFLHKHRLGNPGNASELFLRVSSGKFKCIRPFKYGFGSNRAGNTGSKV
jgi:hypothetical protein